MKIFKVLILSCISLITLVCYAHNDIKYYGPEYEKLTGTVKYLTFPGRPNYTSIKEGDEAEKQPYLILDTTIDVKTRSSEKKAIPNYEDVDNIRLVQLIITHFEDYKVIKEGRRITVKGDISGAIFGHHHAKVLIAVQKLTVASNQNLKPTKNLKKLINRSLRDIDGYAEYAPNTYERVDIIEDDFSP